MNEMNERTDEIEAAEHGLSEEEMASELEEAERMDEQAPSEEDVPAETAAQSPPEEDAPAEVAASEGEAITEAPAETTAETASEIKETEAEIREETAQTEEETEEDEVRATRSELKPAVEALLFVAEEPVAIKQMAKILGGIDERELLATIEELVAEYDARESGFEIREVAGGWRLSTRPQYHDFIRKYLKTRPSARLSLPALETLAVIAYKQPITIPEILEIRGVSSTSAIKTLLEKRLIVTKGRKETVGRPMMYGTSKEFLIQFGLKDLSELPSIEDFEDLA